LNDDPGGAKPALRRMQPKAPGEHDRERI